MRFFIFLLAMVILGWLAQSTIQWPAIALVGILAGAWTGYSGGRNFALGFLAGALVWGSYAIWLDVANEGLLSGRIGELFAGIGSAGVLAVTVLLGGLLGGMGSLTGGFGAKLLAKKPVSPVR